MRNVFFALVFAYVCSAVFASDEQPDFVYTDKELGLRYVADAIVADAKRR